MDPRRQRTIDALLAAGEEAFAARAFEDVKVGEIAAAAGVAVASIYNNFGSKIGLYAAIADRALDVDRAYMDRAYTPDRSPIEQLEAAGVEYLRFYLEHPRFFRLLSAPPPLGSYPGAADIAERLAARIDEQNSRMVDAIERGIAQGTIRPVDPRRCATVLWASWTGIISLGWRPDSLRETDDGITELLELAARLVRGALARKD